MDETSTTHAIHVTDTLLSLQRQGLLCDTAITTADKPVFAHSAVLGAVCPNLMASLNQTPFLEQRTNILVLSQYNSELVQAMIELFYTGRFNENRLPELSQICMEFNFVISVPDVVASSSSCSKKVPKRDIRNHKANVLPKNEGVQLEIAELSDTVQLVEQEQKNIVPLQKCLKRKQPKYKRRVRGKSRMLRYVPANGRQQAVLYACPICSMTMVRRCARQHLINNHHSPDTLCCVLCLKMLPSREKLQRHIGIAHLYERHCNHVCDLCGRQFETLNDLQTHVNKHTGERPHVCDVCGRQYSNYNYMIRHKREHFEEQGQHQCPECGRCYPVLAALRRHIHHHTDERLRTCAVCNKIFTQVGTLRIHMRVHNNERPYQCDECDASFVVKMLLRSHKQRMHASDAEKTHRCIVCDKAFASIQFVKMHMRSHSKCIECTYCGKEFATFWHRQRHVDSRHKLDIKSDAIDMPQM